MGKLTIILVLGLSLSFGIIAWSLNRSNVQTVEITSGYFKYSTARNIARSAINLKLRHIDNGGIATQTVTGNMMGGTYQVDSIFYRNDSLGLRSTATYLDTVYRIRTMFRRYPKPFPNISAAVGLRANNVKFSMNGNPTINGRDHDITGNVLPLGPNDLPGVETLTSTPDSTTVANFNSKITGIPEKIRVNPDMSNPVDFVDEYIANADLFYSAGTYANNMTWGGINNPVIIFADAGSSENKVKFAGSITGWGILVVKGNLEIAGTFKFYGLIIPYSNTQIEFTATSGTPQIVGALLMGGAPNSTFEMKGTGDFKYSSAALEKAKMIGKLLAYRILSWYE